MYRLSKTTFIQIDITTRTLTLYNDNTPLHTYPIAIGKSATPTPIGHWKVINKKIITDPSVFGSRWIGLSAPSYGIHGTNNPASIGTAASLGCIRLYNRDVEELFPLVSIGSLVIIQNGPSVTATGKTHTVAMGDTLWHIANTYHISLSALLKANPNIAPNNLFAGQTIKLP